MKRADFKDMKPRRVLALLLPVLVCCGTAPRSADGTATEASLVEQGPKLSSPDALPILADSDATGDISQKTAQQGAEFSDTFSGDGNSVALPARSTDARLIRGRLLRPGDRDIAQAERLYQAHPQSLGDARIGRPSEDSRLTGYGALARSEGHRRAEERRLDEVRQDRREELREQRREQARQARLDQRRNQPIAEASSPKPGAGGGQTFSPGGQ